jgi:hypothetical protein
MTYILKYDSCGKMQESPDQLSPINPETNETWYSRNMNGKVQLACSYSCVKKIGVAIEPL